MKLLSVNVSLGREILHDGRSVRTGIFKEPVVGRVRLGRLNLVGDAQSDLRVHGGPDKAAYVYPYEHYDHWARALGRNDFHFGQFGENFTVEGMLEDEVAIGDVFRIGTAVVQITQPRVPCYKLGLKMGSPEFPKQFLESGRVGFYLRVVEEGEVGAGDAITRFESDPERFTVRDLFRVGYLEPDDRAAIEKALRLRALSPAWRRFLERRLATPAPSP